MPSDAISSFWADGAVYSNLLSIIYLALIFAALAPRVLDKVIWLAVLVYGLSVYKHYVVVG